ncbi:MAG TPA: lamin tail domain-containing protein, partial [Actinomycetota bacterium]
MPAANAVSQDVVISQIYGGGGNSGAQYTNDFIELFNRGSAPANVGGWSVAYSSATGTGTFNQNSTPLPSVSIPPGGHILVQEGAGAGNGVPLPSPDVTTGSIAMSATAGKVVVADVSPAPACNGGSTACTATQLGQIVDLIGYGTANFFEGAAAPGLSNTTADFRAGSGCVDTDDNSADFSAAPPSPRNSASAPSPCGGPADPAPAVSSTSPANGSGQNPVGTNISVTFSEPVDVTGSWFSISGSASGAHTAGQGGGPTTFTLDPDTDFADGENVTVTIVAADVTDQDASDPPDTMAADFTFTFGTPLRIHDVQGAAHLSPHAGRTVLQVPGIVTALRSNGFYLQDPNPDANAATSEGVFVFTSSAPSVSVGDAVSVSGTVAEFRAGGGASASLTNTEIQSPGLTIVTTSSGNPLPPPVVVGEGGRTPPTQHIDDDAVGGSVENPATPFDAANDGIDFWESLEFMRVQLNDAHVVGPASDFGSNREVPVVGDDGADATILTPRGGILLRQNDDNPERIILNDVIAGGPTLANTVDVGDSYPGATVGVIDYNFNNFKLEVTQIPALLSGNLQQEVTTAPEPGQMAVASFNLENLDPQDPPSKFHDLATEVVTNLRSPDLIGLEEVQDDNGATDDGVVDASATLDMFVAAIQAAGGPAYQFREIDPVNDQDGGEPGGNIRVAFLFRTDRGLSFVDRPGGTSTAANAVQNVGGAPQLLYSPGRIAPGDAAWNASRKPLAAEFMYGGSKVFVIVNHFNSKGGDDPLWGRFQPPTLVTEPQRIRQSTLVNEFTTQIEAADPDAEVVVDGDLND